MASVQVVDNPRHAALLASPVRQRILEALDEPGSASTLAQKLGLSRQAVAYHVKQLEENGYVRLLREESRRGCTERVVERTARYLVAANGLFGGAALDARRLRDKFSSEYLLAIAARMTQEVGEARAAGERVGKPVPTFSSDAEIRFRTPSDRQAFAEELAETVARLVARYHDDKHPDGRSYRFVLGAYPIPGRKT
jgi:DNA-binding transcriptional ArsR family regulator